MRPASAWRNSSPLQWLYPPQRRNLQPGLKLGRSHQNNELYPLSVSSLHLRLFGNCQLLQGWLQERNPTSSEGIAIQSLPTISNSELGVLRSRSRGGCSGRTVKAATQSEMQVNAIGKLSIP